MVDKRGPGFKGLIIILPSLDPSTLDSFCLCVACLCVARRQVKRSLSKKGKESHRRRFRGADAEEFTGRANEDRCKNDVTKG